MQITSSTHAQAHEPRIDRSSSPAFRPISSEDLTLKGLTRRILDMNVGQSIDLRA